MTDSVYLLWTSPDYCNDGCCDRLRGAFLSRDDAEAAQVELERRERKASHDFYPMRVGKVSRYDP